MSLNKAQPAWVDGTPPVPSEMSPDLREKALQMPSLPGVYLMKDSKGGVIYVGKAKNLKARLCQYFSAQGLQGHSLIAMGLVHVHDFDYIITSSEFEALVLENSLIKQHMPKYNILLRDDKGYRWVRITREDWPRLSHALQKHDDGADYLGPYTSGFALKIAVDEVQQIFKLPTCSKKFPRDIGKSRPCLQYFIKRCAAPCAKKISHYDYVRSVREAEDFLKRGSVQGEREIQREMEQAAEELQFERAAALRDRLRALDKLKEKQHVVSVNVEDQDVFALVADQTQACLHVLRFCAGKLCDSEHFYLSQMKTAAESQTFETTKEFRQELLERFYSLRNTNLPKRVLLDGEIENPALLEQWLTQQAGRKVQVQVAQRGEPLHLVELCRQNALEHLANKTGRQGGKTLAALEELARMLGLPAPPQYIEAYDISHTGGADNVAGMVVFKDGVPYKKAYKRFAIKGFAGQDDYASMAEVLDRRFTRYFAETPSPATRELPQEGVSGDSHNFSDIAKGSSLMELATTKALTEGGKNSKPGFGKLPDLILLDGGIGQVHAVQPVLARHELSIPLFGMVKDSKHKTRAITGDGGEIAFASTKQAFALVTKIQEEVHRFAVAYHHQKHKKSTLDSELLKIPGIGPARVKALLTHFKTLKAIKAASEEALAKAPGMTKTAAQQLHAYFRQEGNP